MKKLAAALSALIMASGWMLCAQVTVTRPLPSPPAPEVQAQWNPPWPEPESAIASGRTELSGRLSLGGSAGIDELGSANYNPLTDSRFRLIQPLSRAAKLQMDGKALLRKELEGLTQDYTAEIAFTSEKLALTASGLFAKSDTTEEGTPTWEIAAAAKAALKTTVIPTLPINLSYLHNWKLGQEEAPTEDAQSDAVTLASAGTVGLFGVELTGALNRESDALKNMQVFGTNGTLKLVIPLLPFFSVLTGVAPSYSKTDYGATASACSATSLTSSVGLLFPLSNALLLKLIAGRVDSWSETLGSLPPAVPYQLTWKGELGADVKNLFGLTAAPAYRIAKTIGGNLLNTFSLSAEWLGPEEGFVKKISTAGEVSSALSDSGEPIESKDTWTAAFEAAPADTMTLTAGYSGSFSQSPTTEAGWTHKGNLTFNHEPDPLFDYKASAAVSGQITGDVSTLSQEYSAGLNLKPQRGLLHYLFGAVESMSIAGGGPQLTLLSKASYLMCIPFTGFLTTRYALEWEWINATVPGGSAGNNFRHLVGLAVSGESLPLGFSAEYGLSHGYRGVRHDVNAGVQFAFTKAFILQGKAAFSSYTESDVARFPMLFSLGLAWEF
jgi:hypothetical protein